MMNNQPRQMFDVDLTCAECGQHISQLPFQPTGSRPVYCSQCNRARRPARPTGGFGGGFGGNRGPRQMFSVNLNCAECGTGINELPFEPKGDKPVYCTNCLRARRNRE